MKGVVVGVLVLSACSKDPGAAGPPKPATAPAAPTAAPAPPAVAAPNPARKWGYPTDADCRGALDHLRTLLETDAARLKQLRLDGTGDDAFKSCQKQWLLGMIDCANAATTPEAVDACASESYEVPPGVDVATAPGRATADQCTTAIAHLSKLAPTPYDAETTRLLTNACTTRWRPQVLACVTAATTATAAETCDSTGSDD